MSKPTVFISYSHKDVVYKDMLVTHLGASEREDSLEVWDDKRIGGGMDWLDEIKQAMARARVAVLLISGHFLTSQFIQGVEVPDIMEQRRSEGLVVIPVIVRACTWERIPWLAPLQVLPHGAKPLRSMRGDRVDQALKDIALEILSWLEQPEATSGGKLPSSLAIDQDAAGIEQGKEEVRTATAPPSLTGNTAILSLSTVEQDTRSSRALDPPTGSETGVTDHDEATGDFFFGIYNWSHYLTQSIFFLLLPGACFVFGHMLDKPSLMAAGAVLSAAVAAHGLLLWREERLVLKDFGGEVARRITEGTDLSGCRSSLDAGCGLGRTTIGLLRRLPALRVTAIDIWDSEQILGNSKRQFQRNLECAGVSERVTVKRADVCKLEQFRDDTFDCAQAIWLLHELGTDDQVVALSELSRVVVPRGAIVVVEYVRCLRNFFVFGFINWHYYPDRHWSKVAEEAGLQVERELLVRGIAYLVLRVPARSVEPGGRATGR